LKNLHGKYGSIKLQLIQYKNRKVLITGHTGFKGSWLTIWLQMLGANVAGYALDPKTNRDNFILSNLKNNIKDYRADIRDKEKLFSVFKEEQPEIIFHLAAQPLVIESYINPLDTIETNTQGTTNVLEAFRLSESAKLLVVITTDKVYENNESKTAYTESDRLGGKDPYSASKSAAELIVKAYHNSFFINTKNKKVVTVRAGNVFGGGDWSENRIVPDCIKALEKNEKIILRNPHSTRPWQHVLEPLGGYLMLGEKILNKEIDYGNAWNFGPELTNNITVEHFVKKIIAEYGNGNYEIKINPEAPKESVFLSLDITRAKETLNWKPILSFDYSIKITVEWYKNYQIADVRALCEQQINEYMRKWK
jgi:CDP-glucose 4,6-dehydratase